MDIQLAPAGQIRISWFTPETKCLGPGKRFALWVQGCKQRCKGCIAQQLQSFDGGFLMDIDSLAEEIIASGANGITISGGEPFLQSKALAKLLGIIKRKCPEIGVIIYTGLLYEELVKDKSSAELIALTDILIDGAYISELDDGKAMRGSSNQRLIFLTERYSKDDLPNNRMNKAIFNGSTFRIIGIPSKGAKIFLDIMKSKEENE